MSETQISSPTKTIKENAMITYSNQVLVEQDKKKTVYYLPAYLRLNIKNFTQLNLETLDAEMNATIIFSVYYGNIDDIILDQLKNNIVLQFNRDDPIRLQKNGLDIVLKPDKANKLLNYTIRRKFTMRIVSDVFWSPFEVIDLILTITLQTVEILKPEKNDPSKLSEDKLCDVKFNLMQCQDQWAKISFSKEGTFGNYDLAEKLLKAQYTSDKTPEKIRKAQEKFSQKKQKDQNISKSSKTQKGVKNIQYAHFTIPLYKYPGSAVASIFLPLFLLAAINLCIFFQDNDLANRIASISALTIAFVSLIPNIRQQIPPTPQITYVQYLVFIQAFTSALCLIQSLIDLDDVSSQFQLSDKILFTISTSASIIGFVSVVVMYYRHFTIWQKQYNAEPVVNEPKFKRQNWYSKIGDRSFFQKSDVYVEFDKINGNIGLSKKMALPDDLSMSNNSIKINIEQTGSKLKQE